jgi:hypothetical protein
MGISPRRSSFMMVYSLLLVCIVLNLLVPIPVQADVGPRPILPGGSSIQPKEETPIQMADETITINVRPATEADNSLVKLTSRLYAVHDYSIWYPGVADVEADFTMKNPTSETRDMTVWFPLGSALKNAIWKIGDRPGEIVPRITGFQVSVNGSKVEHMVSELPNPKGADMLPFPWASFPVTFPVEADTVIHVSYAVPLQGSPMGYDMALYYIFQTGAGWAGPIGRAELIVNLPYPASKETMAARQASDSMFTIPDVSTGVPRGAILEGNQARWIWKNFEPGPENDFSIWLILPTKWNELESARAAVKANQQDGQAWLKLAAIYQSLSIMWTGHQQLFSRFYLQPGLDAYRKAIALLPDHPAPHVGVGLLTLGSYPNIKDIPLPVLRSVQKELETAKELEAKTPSLSNEMNLSSLDLEDMLSSFNYNDATASVNAVTQEAYRITQTFEATRDYATRTLWAAAKATSRAGYATEMNCWATAGAACTVSPTATVTPRPTLTATPGPPTTYPLVTSTADATGNGTSSTIILLVSAVGLMIAGYLLQKRSRGKLAE